MFLLILPHFGKAKIRPPTNSVQGPDNRGRKHSARGQQPTQFSLKGAAPKNVKLIRRLLTGVLTKLADKYNWKAPQFPYSILQDKT
jgi:hypothetical protein